MGGFLFVLRSVPIGKKWEINHSEEWKYLAEEREQGIEDSGTPEEKYLEGILHYLVARSEEPSGDGMGSVRGTTPDYTGDHDLGLVYSVDDIQKKANGFL